jgi:catechol 2,3-dioxygenase-like lactoylglutathione lyase family enzyme
MEAIITKLVTQFERGGLTRRQLIQGLSALVATGAASPTVVAQRSGLTGTAVDHISVMVSDLQRSADFYRRVFNLTQVSENKDAGILRLGVGGPGGRIVVSLRSVAGLNAHKSPPGTIDHFAIGVENFPAASADPKSRDTVTQTVKQLGVVPEEGDFIEFGLYVKDPDGARVQFGH